MKYFFNILIFSMVGFLYADCSEIDNQEDCERIDDCEWVENDNMPGGSCIGNWEDDEDESLNLTIYHVFKNIHFNLKYILLFNLEVSLKLLLLL